MLQIKYLNLGRQNFRILKIKKFINKQQCRLQKNSANTTVTEAQVQWKKARPFNEIPGPSVFKIIKDNMPGGKYYKKDLGEMLEIVQKEYGDIMMFPSVFGKAAIVATYNSNDFEVVFRNEGIWPERLGTETLSYHRLKYRADFFKGVQGLISSQGEEWGKIRSKVNPVMLQPKNIRLYLQKLSEVNKQFIEVMKKIRDPKTNEMPDNFKNYINRFSLESVSVVALDKQLGLLNEAEANPMIQKLFDSITEFISLAAELDIKPSAWKYIPTIGFKRIMKAYDNILEITSYYINEALSRMEEEQKNGIEKPDNEKGVLEKLLKIDKKVAIVMAMDMLMAGVDTSTSTFAAILLCLAKNPDKQAKLRAEILRILPEKNSEFNEDSLNDMSYLRACIKEAMRFYPLLFSNGRIVKRDCVLSGYQIPKGTVISMMTKFINRNENFFPQPNEFIPERWIRVPKQNSVNTCPNPLKSNNPFVYLPFGFGPRSCIGRRIAELELELGTARIIRNFNVAFNYPTENAFKSLILNVPNIPLKFELTDLKD